MQGFSQILEDIGALEALITNHRSLGMPEILNIWQKVRIPRVERIRAFTRWNTRVFLGKEFKPQTDRLASQIPPQAHRLKSLKAVKADRSAPFQSGAFLKWVQSYDAVAEAQKAVEPTKARI
jgi:salicylate hydroxylase